jgi:hypothetical protein
MVGIHDYIVVKPENTNVYTHGFSVYKEKIYAHITLTQEVLQEKNIAKLELYKKFENFYFKLGDNLLPKDKISQFINDFKKDNPSAKIIINEKNIDIESIKQSLKAIVVNSATKLPQSRVDELKQYKLDIIGLESVSIANELDALKKINSFGLIPYVSDSEYLCYGKSSKEAVKREIFTLIDERKEDRTLLGAHQVGAMPLEYLGYIEKLHDINQGLPEIDQMRHYAGVIVWLREDYEYPQKLIRWVLDLNKIGIKVAFANNFGFSADEVLLKSLNIDIYDGDESLNNKRKVVYKDKIIGFEVEPSLDKNSLYMHPNNAKPLLTYEDKDGLQSTPAAITAWGGYAISEAFMTEIDSENVWIINPFAFFEEALRLPKITVPDPTTQNGNRLLFTHVDGDGMVNRVESNPELFSGDAILESILKVYKIPHSISLIGAEVFSNGLYPQFSPRVMKISKDMYELENVEPATHTFTHPFFWEKIKDGNLDEEYRLKPKGYKFSLYNELSGALKSINDEILDENSTKHAQTVFWSGDCAPRIEVLEYIYKNNIFNINGGDTTISNTNPWLTLVAPFGLERGEYYQIYTGAQNENVFTNDWLGPFWGFKRVVQTFKLTNSPRRIKPIDVYYHLYSGSKAASLNALKYIFDWAIQQDVMPIFTSEYIPKVMDYYTVSMANEGDEWLVEGMRDLKTLRIEESNASVDFQNSPSVLGIKHFENHTYISLDNSTKHLLREDKKRDSKESTYLISSNAKLTKYVNEKDKKSMQFEGHVDLKLNFHLSKGCNVIATPKATKESLTQESLVLEFADIKKAKVDVVCR